MHNFTESRVGDCLGDERDHVRRNKKMQKNCKEMENDLDDLHCGEEKEREKEEERCTYMRKKAYVWGGKSKN